MIAVEGQTISEIFINVETEVKLSESQLARAWSKAQRVLKSSIQSDVKINYWVAISSHGAIFTRVVDWFPLPLNYARREHIRNGKIISRGMLFSAG